MRVPKHQTDRGRLDVKMTPMIDVVFLLLIFFVCTASFQILEETLPTSISLPEAAALTQPIDIEHTELEPIVVKVRSQDGGRVVWEVGQAVYDRLDDVRAALARLAELEKDLPVILDIDGQVPVGDVVAVYDACLLAGFERIQFAASVEATP